MTGPVSTRATKGKNTDGAARHSQEKSHPTPTDPQADILALQDAAGNQAVNQLLQTSSPAIGGVPTIVSDVLKSGGGQPLDLETRTEMEANFGEDFSQVRVHTDAMAAESAKAVNAHAYTVGQHIIFGNGQYAPETVSGKSSLVHEMTHVAQQSGGTEIPDVKVLPTVRTERWEAEAEQVAVRSATRGSEAQPTEASSMDTGVEHSISPAPAGILQGQFITPLGQGGGFSGLVERDRQATLGERVPAGPLKLSVPEAIRGGKRLIVDLDEETLKSANLEQRIAMLLILLEAWTGNAEEEAIIRILRRTPGSQAPHMIKQLRSENINGEPLLVKLDRDVHLGNNLELHDELSLLRLQAKGPEVYTQTVEQAPVLPWHDTMNLPFMDDRARFSVRRTRDGKIRVKYPALMNLSTTDFDEEVRRLPDDMFAAGHDYEPEQLLIVHDYDRDGRFVPVLADQLTGYRWAYQRAFLAEVGEAASWGLPGGGLAKSVLGKALAILGKAVLAAVFLINQNRLQIVKWFPKWGPKMLYYADLVQVGIGLYGLAQFARSGWRLFRSWKDVKRPQLTNLDPEAERVALEFERSRDEIVDQVEIINNSVRSEQKGVSISGATRVGEPPTSAANKGGKLLSMEGRPPVGPELRLKPGPRDPTNLGEFRARKARSEPPTPPTEPASQPIPKALEESETVYMKEAVGARKQTRGQVVGPAEELPGGGPAQPPEIVSSSTGSGGKSGGGQKGPLTQPDITSQGTDPKPERTRKPVEDVKTTQEGLYYPEPRARGGANERFFCNEQDLKQLSQYTKIIDAYDPQTAKTVASYTDTTNGRTVTIIERADVFSVKSRETLRYENFVQLDFKLRDDLDALVNFPAEGVRSYPRTGVTEIIRNPNKKVLAFIFDEAEVFSPKYGGEKTLLQIMEETTKAAKDKGVEFRWFVNRGGQQQHGPAFFKRVLNPD